MAANKLVDSAQLDSDLTSVANAIRTKGGTSASLTFPADFVSAIAAIPTGGGNLQSKTRSYTPSETAQSETVTADVGYDGLDEVDISVGAISSTYVGSGITRRSSSDMAVSGDTVTAPAGYYENAGSTSVASGTAGTPSATKGAVSNHSVDVTPSVTNTTGYITGGTKTGTAVSVTAAELVSGSETKTANGTYDVTNLAQLIVNVGGSLPLLATQDVGSINSTSTSATDLNKSITVSGINAYDLLLVVTSVNSVVNNRHQATARLIWLTASSAIGTKDGASIANATWNVKVSSSGVKSSRSSNTAYGVYPNSCTVSSGSATIPMYRRYNSSNTGTLNGTYTARVYGVKVYDLLGG